MTDTVVMGALAQEHLFIDGHERFPDRQDRVAHGQGAHMEIHNVHNRVAGSVGLGLLGQAVVGPAIAGTQGLGELLV